MKKVICATLKSEHTFFMGREQSKDILYTEYNKYKVSELRSQLT